MSSSVPGLSKRCRPGTVAGHRAASGGDGCSRSVEKVQTWNGGRPQSGLWRGRVCQVCRKSADLERGGTTESALLGVNDEEPQKAYVNGCVHTAIA